MLLPGENILIGRWIFNDGSICRDPVADRIEWLILHHLKKVTVIPPGWDVLYKDPVDNRLWELVYSQREMPGGGSPSLIHLSFEEACRKYNYGGLMDGPTGVKIF
jgi:hypothetical protein